MSNAAASVVIPCCPKPGACINCCGDGTGVIFDLTGILPAVGTYDHPDGGTLEIVRVSMMADTDHIRFGPALWPSGANADAMGPLAYCCAFTIGYVEVIKLDSMAVEEFHGFGCIRAGVASVGGETCLIIELTQDAPLNYWFYRNINRTTGGLYPQQARFCAKPRAWIDLSNDTATALDSGIALHLKGTDIQDTAQPMATATTCANPCKASYDITITLSGFSGKTLGAYTIVEDSIELTAVGYYDCGSGWTETTAPGLGTLALSHATFMDACLKIGITIEYDNETGRFRFEDSSVGGVTTYGTIYTDCADEDTFLEPTGNLSEHLFDLITCGNAQMEWTGTLDFEWDGGSEGTIDVAVVAN